MPFEAKIKKAYILLYKFKKRKKMMVLLSRHVSHDQVNFVILTVFGMVLTVEDCNGARDQGGCRLGTTSQTAPTSAEENATAEGKQREISVQTFRLD